MSARVRGARPSVPVKTKRPSARARRASGAHARRRGRTFAAPRVRLGFPRAGRLLAAVLACALGGGLMALINGPWLRVAAVGSSPTQYVTGDELSAVLNPVKGTSLLALDERALVGRLRALPAVADAQIDPRIPDGLVVSITEKAPAYIWQTSAVRLVVARDGMVIGEIALREQLSGAMARLPLVDDQRRSSHDFSPGDRIPAGDAATALRLAGTAPALLGSAAPSLQVHIDERCGYLLTPKRGAAWSAALGFYTDDGGAGSASILDDQLAAVRTLFAAHRETAVSWVDARNPGKVYWRPNGLGGSDAC
jgi:POTRA domain, FtsQ-type